MHITTGSAELDAAILSIGCTIVATLILRFLSSKTKVKYHVPHVFNFTISPSQPNTQPYNIRTATLSVVNYGKKVAENVEIFHEVKPTNFQVYPATKYEEDVNPEGHHIIRVKKLAPKEQVSIEMLSPNWLPQLLRVKSDDGDASQGQMRTYLALPKWVEIFMIILMFIGAATIFYFLLRTLF